MEFRLVTAEEKTLLYNLLQKYLYEMTTYYADDLDESGNYPYPYFDAYFTDRDRRALLLLEDGRLVGFALLNRHSEIGREIDYGMAEFSILPKERGRGLGLCAARSLFEGYPGRWEVKYSAANLAGKSLWSRAAEPYGPQKTVLPTGEEVLAFETGPKGGTL